ncbi:MAG: molybdopterin biosynthesis protein [Polyangia bacterium]|jgi:putative molybdopterin biosynthesis protein|nr:molybdopterin biosynthesis protein [Polyangia bacterium]
MKRNVYLSMKPLPEARAMFLESFPWTELQGVEELPTGSALGRVTAEPHFAALSSPGYHGAAMDGFALRAELSFGASEERPVRLRVGSQAFPVNTGNPLHAGTDAVAIIEQVQRPSEDEIELSAAVFPWQHVRRVGEDMVAGELLLPHHHRLTAVDLAALVTAGVFRVRVRRRPVVAIICTGSELVDWQEADAGTLAPGAIIESNSLLLAGLVEEAGGTPRILPRQPDVLEKVLGALDQAVASDADLVVVNAGASAGTKDFTSHAVSALGEVLVHGVMAMPGKPTLLGRIRGKPVVGAPGYPLSAWVCFDQFVRPALERLGGLPESRRPRARVTPGRRLPSKLGQEEFLRVHLGRVAGQVVALPLKRGASTITSLTRADGILRIPPELDGHDAGEVLEAELLRPAEALEQTLVVVGSHDITIDLIADRLPRLAPGMRISASNVGSLGGLLALRERRSLLGGTHLLDPETGEYNAPYLARHLPGLPVRLVTLVHREQGLLVRRGNPKGLRSFEDLAGDGVSFVNRQAGSGTRVLLDYHLGRLGIDPGGISGYDLEEYTHTGVAVQVLSGGADAGLGILAAAKALGLDFVPLATERYDLCIPEEYLGDPRIEALLELLGDPGLRAAITALGGYDVSQMGRLAWPR